jgi:hypothetical protein
MRRTRREPRLKSGALLLTHNQLALLQGLLDRPRGVARSRHDLARAALPYMKRFRPRLPSYWTLYHATVNLPAAWVRRRRAGNRIEFRILPRGRAILEGRVLVHVQGVGPYVPRSRRVDIPSLAEVSYADLGGQLQDMREVMPFDMSLAELLRSRSHGARVGVLGGGPRARPDAFWDMRMNLVATGIDQLGRVALN